MAGADIHVAPSGKFVYGSNRGHDSIDHQTGHLHPTGHITQIPNPVCIKLLPV